MSKEVTIETLNGGAEITKINQALRALTEQLHARPEMFITKIKEKDGAEILTGKAAVGLEIVINYELAPNGQIENLTVGCPVQLKFPKSAADGYQAEIKTSKTGIKLCQQPELFAVS